MHKILRNGGLPLVKYQAGSAGNPTLDYVQAAPGSRYAAISHLWADGRGNPYGQSIPQCQLKNLTQRIAQSNAIFGSKNSRSRYFWFDVYCVPVTRRDISGLSNEQLSEEVAMRELKATALARMTASYSWAHYVLVLDYELEQFSGQGSLTELMARLAICSWNSRCWTYQEFVFGKQVVVWFSDGPKLLFDDASTNKSTSKLRTSSQARCFDTAGSGFLQQDITALTHQMKQDDDKLGYVRGPTGLVDRTKAFILVCNTLNAKSTTKPEDCLDIIANLMGLSIMELSKLDSNERVKAILRTLPSWPMDLLLTDNRSCQRWMLEGRTDDSDWNPEDLYRAQFDASIGSASLSKRGLLIGWPYCQSVGQTATFCFRVGGGKTWPARVKCEDALSPKFGHYSILMNLDVDGESWARCEEGSAIVVMLRMVGAKTGACFVPVDSKKRYTQVKFLCNLKWQRLEDERAGRPSSFDEFEMALDFRYHECKIYIHNSVNEWRRPKVRRDRLELFQRRFEITTKLTFWTTFYFLITGSIITTLVCATINVGWSPLEYVAMTTPSLLVIIAVGFVSRVVLDYQSLQSHLDGHARLLRLRKTFPSLTSELLPLTGKLTVLVVYAILIPLELVFWMQVIIRWLVRTAQRLCLHSRQKRRGHVSSGDPLHDTEMV